MFNKNFYPTPRPLVDKMLTKVNLDLVSHILEPSAGKGDICEAIKEKTEYSRRVSPSIDTIEYSEQLRSILRDKSYNVIHDDFLTFRSFKRYDLIIMNPPFDNGCQHLLKAIEVQSRGGQIICILNAETIKNPYSNDRDKLIRLLDQHNAEIEYLQETFRSAERKTGVEIALIHIDIEHQYKDTLILDNLKNEIIKEKQEQGTKDITSNDPIEQAIERFNFEVKAGLDLIYNYFNMQPIINSELKEEKYSWPILELKVHGESRTGLTIVNKYIEEVRYKYWKGLIDMGVFRQLLTTNLIDEFQDKLVELRQFDFSRFNIDQVMGELKLNLQKGVEETIYELFKDLTRTYSYDEYSSNVHLYDGWKTNISYKINDRKVIYPRLSAYNSIISPGTFTPTYGGAENKIRDIEKALNYLDNGRTETKDDILEILKEAEENNESKNVEFKYFYIDFYRKGTGHIKWKDKDLIKKLNIFGSKKEGSLPPSYGKKKYSDMTKQEKKVIDSFEGEKEYKKTMEDTKFYLYESTDLLQLGGS